MSALVQSQRVDLPFMVTDEAGNPLFDHRNSTPFIEVAPLNLAIPFKTIKVFQSTNDFGLCQQNTVMLKRWARMIAFMRGVN